MGLENKVKGSFFDRIRKSLTGKIVGYGLIGSLAFSGVYGLSGCTDKQEKLERKIEKRMNRDKEMVRRVIENFVKCFNEEDFLCYRSFLDPSSPQYEVGKNSVKRLFDNCDIEQSVEIKSISTRYGYEADVIVEFNTSLYCADVFNSGKDIFNSGKETQSFTLFKRGDEWKIYSTSY